MNLYKISQDAHRDYDTFDSAVVRIESEGLARQVIPRHLGELKLAIKEDWDDQYSAWCSSPDLVTVELLAEDVKGERALIVASFNAG